MEHVPNPTRTRGYGSGRVNPRVRVYPQSPNVGADAGAYNEVHGNHGFGASNSEGESILEFAVAHDLLVGNILFKKRDSHLITYTSGNLRSQVDYILY